MMRFSRRTKGITLVELVIGVVIVSALAGAGVESFLMIQKVSREMDEQSAQTQSARLIFEDIQRSCSNLAPRRISGLQPFSEMIDASSNQRIYQMLVRVPEGYRKDEVPGEIWAILARYVYDQTDGQNELRYSHQNIGLNGLAETKDEGVLGRNLSEFSISAIYDTPDGQGTAEDTLPSALKIHLAFESGGQSRGFAGLIPIFVRPDKK